MDGFTIVDGVVAVIILISAILAYSRGFVREGMSIAGWIFAAIVAYIFAPRAVARVPASVDAARGREQWAIAEGIQRCHP